MYGLVEKHAYEMYAFIEKECLRTLSDRKLQIGVDTAFKSGRQGRIFRTDIQEAGQVSKQVF